MDDIMDTISHGASAILLAKEGEQA